MMRSCTASWRECCCSARSWHTTPSTVSSGSGPSSPTSAVSPGRRPAALRRGGVSGAAAARGARTASVDSAPAAALHRLDQDAHVVLAIVAEHAAPAQLAHRELQLLIPRLLPRLLPRLALLPCLDLGGGGGRCCRPDPRLSAARRPGGGRRTQGAAPPRAAALASRPLAQCCLGRLAPPRQRPAAAAAGRRRAVAARRVRGGALRRLHLPLDLRKGLAARLVLPRQQPPLHLQRRARLAQLLQRRRRARRRRRIGGSRRRLRLQRCLVRSRVKGRRLARGGGRARRLLPQAHRHACLVRHRGAQQPAPLVGPRGTRAVQLGARLLLREAHRARVRRALLQQLGAARLEPRRRLLRRRCARAGHARVVRVAEHALPLLRAASRLAQLTQTLLGALGARHGALPPLPLLVRPLLGR
eukprot:scaffold10110_cov69-Phaeocystis_antarctica.AAC.21